MLTLEKIKEYVADGRFGLDTTLEEGLADYSLSSGIRYCLKEEKDRWLPFILKAVRQVSEGNTGDFYGVSEQAYRERDLKRGSAYYQCDSPLGPDFNSSIMVHQDFRTLEGL